MTYFQIFLYPGRLQSLLTVSLRQSLLILCCCCRLPLKMHAWNLPDFAQSECSVASSHFVVDFYCRYWAYPWQVFGADSETFACTYSAKWKRPGWILSREKLWNFGVILLWDLAVLSGFTVCWNSLLLHYELVLNSVCNGAGDCCRQNYEAQMRAAGV